MEYLQEQSILEIKEIKNKKKHCLNSFFNKLLKRFEINLFRTVLVRPLYRSAKLSEPTLMREALMRAKEILPTNKPYGELAPYVGEALLKLDNGTELFLNIAPEGCMVASMGEMLTTSIYRSATNKKKNARIQGLFSGDGEIDNDKLIIALLKILGPERYYQKN